MTREEMLQAVGRGYTHEGHTHKPVDVDLCVAMVEELLAAQAQAAPATNSAMVPCECVHGIPINVDCSVCKEHMGVGRRVVAQHQ